VPAIDVDASILVPGTREVLYSVGIPQRLIIRGPFLALLPLEMVAPSAINLVSMQRCPTTLIGCGPSSTVMGIANCTR